MGRECLPGRCTVILVIRRMKVRAGVCLFALVIGGLGCSGRSASRDLSWQTVAADTNVSYRGITFADGQFMATTSRGEILVSSDAVSWRPRHVDAKSVALGAVACGGGRCVVLSMDGTLYSSPAGGARWEAHSVEQGSLLNAVLYADGKFVVVGANGLIAWSTNGREWAKVPDTLRREETLHGIAFDSVRKQFVVVGANGVVLTSSGALEWTQQDTTTTVILLDVAAGDRGLVAVGNEGVILVSETGTSWNRAGSTVHDAFSHVEYGNGRFVAVSRGGDSATSSDGKVWTVARVPAVPRDLTFGNGLFVAVADGVILTGK